MARRKGLGSTTAGADAAATTPNPPGRGTGTRKPRVPPAQIGFLLSERATAAVRATCEAYGKKEADVLAQLRVAYETLAFREHLSSLVGEYEEQAEVARQAKRAAIFPEPEPQPGIAQISQGEDEP